MTADNNDLRWPLGRSGDKTLLVLDSDAGLIAPILDGEPEPEDHSDTRWALLGIPDLGVEPERLAEELTRGPDDVWVVLPRSEAAAEFYATLAETMVAADIVPPAPVFLPEPLTLPGLVDALPSGPDAGEMGAPSRHSLFIKALILLWISNAPDEWLSPFILAEVSPDTHSGIV